MAEPTESDFRKTSGGTCSEYFTKPKIIRAGPVIATVIVRVTYGSYLTDEDDPCFSIPMQTMSDFSTAAVPGDFLVKFFPVLRYLPKWMPGAGFLKKAEEWGKNQYDSAWMPYKWTEDHMSIIITSCKRLQARHTFLVLSALLHERGGNLSPNEKHNLVWSTSAVLGGGLDTISNVKLKLRSTLYFALADRPSLPYIRALVTELYRWRTAGPLGIAHSLNKDDVYNGFVIKKGTIIIPNVWHMLHDPNTYPDPMTFNPERYKGLDTEMKKVTDLAFGFGRRACPGYHFAQGTIYSVIMTTLATCDILPPTNADGKQYIPEIEHSSGTISVPSHFDVRIKSRLSRAQELLHDVLSKERM
ncbi:hypothetical protein Clacol_008614 [Clathrus columnatus]|uniref:Cytochrome P450 n=1 Tax=Clathrus columnatus TaxID=1419009 RepID=A0AAV5AR49_9AGAM|nr:hypothetical protein Clacol_008614 [Clathrus columnatus]